MNDYHLICCINKINAIIMFCFALADFIESQMMCLSCLLVTETNYCQLLHTIDTL